ncbi:MAG: PAS domain-containing protein [Sphingomonadales bacterium]
MLIKLEPRNGINTADWHPLLRGIYQYWLDIHPNETTLPGRRQFDPMAVHRILPHVWMLAVAHEPLRMEYRLLGTKIDEVAGRNLSGWVLEEAHPHVNTDLEYAQRYRIPATKAVGVWVAGKPLFQIEPIHKTTEAVILPLASDGVTVDLLLGATVFYRSDGSEY